MTTASTSHNDADHAATGAQPVAALMDFAATHDLYMTAQTRLAASASSRAYTLDAEVAARLRALLDDPDRAEAVERGPAKTLGVAKPVQPSGKRSLTCDDLRALCAGHAGQVFGQSHRGVGADMRIACEQELMLDRITDLGSWRPGGDFVLEGEKTFASDGRDLRAAIVAGATQLLKAYLLANGFHLVIADPAFESNPDGAAALTMADPIPPEIGLIRYEARVVETGLLPRPFIHAEIIVRRAERLLARLSNLTVRIRERRSIEPRLGDESWDSGRRTTRGEPVLLSELHLAHAAKGDLRTAMGAEFGVYGDGRRAPHIPNGCFQFVDRGVRIDGARGALDPGARMINEYDSPPDAWYYAENSYPRMPNAAYMEGALQAAILLGYFLGPTLRYPQNAYSIRNLDGKAVYLADMDTRGKTLRHYETLKSNALTPDAIVQSFDFKVECEGTPVYEGWSSFGYFTANALSEQVGLDAGRRRRFWHESEGAGRPLAHVDLSAPAAQPYFAGGPDKPHYRLAEGRLRLLHSAWLDAGGGRHGAGYVKGYRQVTPDDWYFARHFHRDPVQPGSLGVESMLQSIQLFALMHGIGADFANPRFGVAVGVPMTWKYRGQISPKDQHMITEVHIREVRREADRIVIVADGDLYNDRLRIYEAQGLSVAITEAAPPPAADPSPPRAVWRAAEIAEGLRRLDEPGAVVTDGARVGLWRDMRRAPDDLRTLCVFPPIRPEDLGSAAFRGDHGVRYAYKIGAMANGVSSPDLVIAAAKAGLLASYGAGGVPTPRVEAAIARILDAVGERSFAVNVLHAPHEPAMEDGLIDVLLRKGVRRIEASAFLSMQKSLVRFRAAGLRAGADGAPQIDNKIIAKVSHPAVAEQFLRPAPAAMLDALLADGAITAGQRDLALRVPMADDVTVEADSGGHTDRRPLSALFPTMLRLRDRAMAQMRYARPVRMGAGGGIGSGAAAAGAFAMGADYIVTGSINQACVESGASDLVRAMLAEAEPSDCAMAPAADMFEMGAEVQVLRRGTLFAARARQLYDLYRRYESLEDLPADTVKALETQYYRRPLAEVWRETAAYFNRRDPAQVSRAEGDPKRKMALVFRAYLGQASDWANAGLPDRKADYQIWTGPAIGDFNDWARGSYLAPPHARRVVEVAEHVMRAAAFETRLNWLAMAGARFARRPAYVIAPL